MLAASKEELDSEVSHSSRGGSDKIFLGGSLADDIFLAKFDLLEFCSDFADNVLDLPSFAVALLELILVEAVDVVLLVVIELVLDDVLEVTKWL